MGKGKKSSGDDSVHSLAPQGADAPEGGADAPKGCTGPKGGFQSALLMRSERHTRGSLDLPKRIVRALSIYRGNNLQVANLFSASINLKSNQKCPYTADPYPLKQSLLPTKPCVPRICIVRNTPGY